MDNGLSEGIGKGVGNLFGGLIGVKKMIDENRRHDEDRSVKEREMQMQAARYGLLKGDNGDYQMSPEAAEDKAFKKRMLQIGGEKNALELQKLQREQSPEALDTAARGKVSQQQWSAAGYANRIKQADAALNEPKEDYDPTSTYSAFQRMNPIEALKGGGQKQQEQAELNFLMAVLRKESGAAISGSEIDTGKKQYFPQAGDTPKVLAQKAQNRAAALQAMEQEAGPAIAFSNKPPAGLLGGGRPQMAQQPQRGLLSTPDSTSAAGDGSDETSQALDWARSNPQDPRSKAILQKLGVK